MSNLPAARRRAAFSAVLAALMAIALADVSADSARAQTVLFPSPRSICAQTPDHMAIYRYDGTGTSWTKLQDLSSAKLYGGGWGLVATGAFTGNLYRYGGSPGSFVQIGGPGAEFAVTNDTVFGLAPDRQAVYRYDGGPWSTAGGPAAHLYGGGYGLVATDPNSGDVYRYLGGPWQRIGGPAAEFAVTNTTVFALSSDRQAVWRYDGTGTSWTKVGGPRGKLYGGASGLVATEPATGNLWRYQAASNSWQQIGGPAAEVAMTSIAVFALTPDRQAVYRWDGSGTSWSKVGGPASSIVPCP